MPLKIAMIGAGSIGFTRRLTHDRKHKRRRQKQQPKTNHY